MARIISKKFGVDYALTREDRRWAYRMVIGEGCDEAPEVLWTMINRFVFLLGADLKRSRKPRYPTFASLIKAYSQPINPKWRRDGSACEGRWRGTDACSPARLKRREALSRASRSALIGQGECQREAILAVDLLFDGRLPNPVPGAVDFAVPRLVARRVAQHSQNNPSLSGSDSPLYRSKAGNHFIAHPSTLGWNRATVQVVSVGGSIRKIATMAAVVGAASAAYFLT